MKTKMFAVVAALLFSLVAAGRVRSGGRVFSFEPSEREFRRLVQHIVLNRLSVVTPVRQVVADNIGPFDVRIASRPHAGQNTIASSFGYASVGTERIDRVDGVTLDSFVTAHGLDRVDLVKVDVEGAERAVLAGARDLLRVQRPLWILEVVPEALAAFGAGADDLARVFADASYRLIAIDSVGCKPLDVGVGDHLGPGNVLAVPSERWHDPSIAELFR